MDIIYDTGRKKDLLLRDLCARLPYGVKVKLGDNPNIFDLEYRIKFAVMYGDSDKLEDILDIINIKPYLFPLSSLTEEQRNNICQLLLDTQNKFSPYGEINSKGCDNLFISSVKQSNVLINYCLANHLDINGLIEKGLAIDATGLNIYDIAAGKSTSSDVD